MLLRVPLIVSTIAELAEEVVKVLPIRGARGMVLTALRERTGLRRNHGVHLLLNLVECRLRHVCAQRTTALEPLGGVLLCVVVDTAEYTQACEGSSSFIPVKPLHFIPVKPLHFISLEVVHIGLLCKR